MHAHCSVINFAMLNGSRWKESHGFIYLAESPKDASNKDSPASQSSVADSGVFSIQSNSPSKGDGTTSGTSPDSPNARYPDQHAFNSREGHGQCKFSPFRDLRLTLHDRLQLHNAQFVPGKSGNSASASGGPAGGAQGNLPAASSVKQQPRQHQPQNPPGAPPQKEQPKSASVSTPSSSSPVTNSSQNPPTSMSAPLASPTNNMGHPQQALQQQQQQIQKQQHMMHQQQQHQQQMNQMYGGGAMQQHPNQFHQHQRQRP